MMMASWQDKDVAGGGVEEEVEETDVPSMTSGRWNPINRPRTPGFAIIEDEDEDESMEDLPETPPSGRNPPSQTFSPVGVIISTTTSWPAIHSAELWAFFYIYIYI